MVIVRPSSHAWVALISRGYSPVELSSILFAEISQQKSQ
jgi:hypothetical protein